jgi:hypothetical protein
MARLPRLPYTGPRSRAQFVLLAMKVALGCRNAINCETRVLCAMQRQLTGSSAILVQGTTVCLPSGALGADVRVRGATHNGDEWTLETVRVGPSRCPGLRQTVGNVRRH